MRKRVLRILPAGVLLAWLLTVGAAGAGGGGIPFPDVSEGDRYYDAVKYVHEKGWMLGTADGEFRPGEPLSRGAFVTLLGRVAGVSPAPALRTVFRDVPAEQYYEPYVRWAAEENLVNGYTDGSFGPDDPMTRQDVTVILDRYLTFLGLELPALEDPAPLADGEEVSDYARSSVELIRTVGLLYSDGNGRFHPRRSATRAEAAQVFYRLGLAMERAGQGEGDGWTHAGASAVLESLTLEQARLSGGEVLDLDGRTDNDAAQTDNFAVLVSGAKIFPVESWSLSGDGRVYTYPASEPPQDGDVICLRDGEGTVALFRTAHARENADGTVSVTRDDTAALEDLYSILKLTAGGDSGLPLPAGEFSWEEKDFPPLETVGKVTAEPRMVLRLDGSGLYGELVTTLRLEARLTAREELFDVGWTIPLSGEGALPADLPGLTVTFAPMELELTVEDCGPGEIAGCCTIESGVVFRSGGETQFIRRAEGRVTQAPEEDFRITLGLTGHTGAELEEGAVRLEAATGALLTLAGQRADTGPSADGRSDHACALCLSGQALLELEGTGSGALRERDGEVCSGTASAEKDLFPLDEFYQSVLHPENGLGWNDETVMGEGACPNRRFRVELFTAGMDGERVEGLPVTVTGEGLPSFQGISPAVFYLYPGEYQATALFGTARQVLPVTVGSAPRSITLWEPRSRLSAVVKTAEGQIMPGLTVTVSRDGQTAASAVTDDQGICSFDALPLGEYSVSVSRFLYQTATVTASLTQDGDWVWKGLRLVREADPAPSVLARLEELRTQFPAGKYWNHRGVEVAPGQETWNIVTDRPCSHAPYVEEPWENQYYGVTSDLLNKGEPGTQCFGFASMLSDQIFGPDAPIRTFQTFDDLRVGDQIRYTVRGHSMVVIEKGKDYIAVAEANADYRTCRIAWGRIIRKSTLESYGRQVLYMTRYPD